MLKRVTFSIYFLSAGVSLTPDGLDECDVVSMLDRSVSCCVMLLASSYRAHVLEKLTDCYAFLEHIKHATMRCPVLSVFPKKPWHGVNAFWKKSSL